MPTSDPRAALSVALARLSERCRRLDEVPDGGVLLRRTEQLADAVDAALATPATRPPCLAVTSLGRFRLLQNDRPLPPCPARRAVAVFRYLLTRPDRAAPKAELAESIWPAAAPKIAAHNLHVAVSTLRHYLVAQAGTSSVTLSAGAYGLHPALTVVDDADTFRRAASRAARLYEAGDRDAAVRAHVEAIAGYTGDYCTAELDFAWAAGERDRHLTDYLATLYRLGRMHLESRRYEDAAHCMTRILERDCYREDVYFHLMICYSRLGRRGHAIEQYHRCAGLLRAHLGIAPAPRLRRLYELILADGG